MGDPTRPCGRVGSRSRLEYFGCQVTAGAVTRRVLRGIEPRQVYWSYTLADAAAQLRSVDRMDGTRCPLPRRYFVCESAAGDRPGGVDGVAAYAFPRDGLPAGWSHDERGHYLDNDAPVLRYVRDDGHKLEIMRASVWFPTSTQRPSQCAEASRLLRGLVAGAFPGAVLMTTPATTGRELLARSLPVHFEEPTLPDDVQQVIRETSGQGRITRDEELRDRARRQPELSRLCVFDARFAYAALCRELPNGPAERLPMKQARELDQYARARLRVRVTVPKDWRDRCACGAPGHAGIGLLGVRADDGDGWRYPAEPGQRFETWCEGAELFVARVHGWRVDVREAIYWPGKARPMDRWARQLVALRDAIEAARDVDPAVVALVRLALRQLVLSTIGALHGSPRQVTYAVPAGDPRAKAAAAAGHAVRRRAGVMSWSETRPAAWPAMSRPEWSACIWSRQRARTLEAPTAGAVLAGALHVPAADVLAIRTDALYLAGEPPQWPDDGRPGRYTLRADVPGPIPTPASTDALRRAVGAV